MVARQSNPAVQKSRKALYLLCTSALWLTLLITDLVWLCKSAKLASNLASNHKYALFTLGVNDYRGYGGKNLFYQIILRNFQWIIWYFHRKGIEQLEMQNSYN